MAETIAEMRKRGELAERGGDHKKQTPTLGDCLGVTEDAAQDCHERCQQCGTGKPAVKALADSSDDVVERCERFPEKLRDRNAPHRVEIEPGAGGGRLRERRPGAAETFGETILQQSVMLGRETQDASPVRSARSRRAAHVDPPGSRRSQDRLLAQGRETYRPILEKPK